MGEQVLSCWFAASGAARLTSVGQGLVFRTWLLLPTGFFLAGVRGYFCLGTLPGTLRSTFLAGRRFGANFPGGQYELAVVNRVILRGLYPNTFCRLGSPFC